MTVRANCQAAATSHSPCTGAPGGEDGQVWGAGPLVPGGNVAWCSCRGRSPRLPRSVSAWSPHGPAVPALGAPKSSGSSRPRPCRHTRAPRGRAHNSRHIHRLTDKAGPPASRRPYLAQGHRLRHREAGNHTERTEAETGGPVLRVPFTCNAQDRPIRRDRAGQRLGEWSLGVVWGRQLF